MVILVTHRTSLLKACDELLIMEDGKIIGMISFTESQSIYSGGIYGSIDEMYVEPQYRSSKIGHLMVEKVKKMALERKWTRIVVTAPTGDNERAVNFYERNGFQFTGPKLKWLVGL